MNEELNNLITALREELTQYGEVLALMQEQQELIINRSANDLLLNLNAVNEQMERVAVTRQQRELCRQQLVASLGGTDETTFREMTAMLPVEVQPLLDALVQEINQLLQNIQKWLRQNHMLLQRSLDLMQTIMKTTNSTFKVVKRLIVFLLSSMPSSKTMTQRACRMAAGKLMTQPPYDPAGRQLYPNVLSVQTSSFSPHERATADALIPYSRVRHAALI